MPSRAPKRFRAQSGDECPRQNDVDNDASRRDRTGHRTCPSNSRRSSPCVSMGACRAWTAGRHGHRHNGRTGRSRPAANGAVSALISAVGSPARVCVDPGRHTPARRRPVTRPVRWLPSIVNRGDARLRHHAQRVGGLRRAPQQLASVHIDVPIAAADAQWWLCSRAIVRSVPDRTSGCLSEWVARGSDRGLNCGCCRGSCTRLVCFLGDAGRQQRVESRRRPPSKGRRRLAGPGPIGGCREHGA
jgi:hypothetical protein